MVKVMRFSKKLQLSRIRFRYRVLAAASFSTLAATGFTQAAVIYPKTEQGVAAGSIGYIGPVPTQPAATATGNTLDIAVVGFDITNSSSGFAVNDAAYLIGPLTPTFGTTLTDKNATIDGETATVTSTETVSKGTTTDKITLSVPTRFVPVGSTFTDGDVINEEDLEIGFDAGTQGLTFSLPVTTHITASGSAVYNYNSSKHTFVFSTADGDPPYTYLAPGDTMLSADEGLSDFTDSTDYTAYDLTQYNLSSFSFTFSYATPTAVPEPGTAAVGLILGVGLLRRRTRRSSTVSSVVDLSSGLVDEPVAPAEPSEGSAIARSGGENGSIGETRLI